MTYLNKNVHKSSILLAVELELSNLIQLLATSKRVYLTIKKVKSNPSKGSFAKSQERPAVVKCVNSLMVIVSDKTIDGRSHCGTQHGGCI